jgi:hypothetical protein
MRIGLQIISWIALAVTIVAPVLYFAGRISLDQTKSAMLLATVVWFVAVPFWMGRPKVEEELVI